MRISDWSSDVCSSDLAAGDLLVEADRIAFEDAFGDVLVVVAFLRIERQREEDRVVLVAARPRHRAVAARLSGIDAVGHADLRAHSGRQARDGHADGVEGAGAALAGVVAPWRPDHPHPGTELSPDAG